MLSCRCSPNFSRLFEFQKPLENKIWFHFFPEIFTRFITRLKSSFGSLNHEGGAKNFKFCSKRSFLVLFKIGARSGNLGCHQAKEKAKNTQIKVHSPMRRRFSGLHTENQFQAKEYIHKLLFMFIFYFQQLLIINQKQTDLSILQKYFLLFLSVH